MHGNEICDSNNLISQYYYMQQFSGALSYFTRRLQHSNIRMAKLTSETAAPPPASSEPGEGSIPAGKAAAVSARKVVVETGVAIRNSAEPRADWHGEARIDVTAIHWVRRTQSSA